MSVFLGELSKVAAESLNVVVLDNAPAHIARGLVAFGGIFHVVPQTSAHRARAGGRREHRVVGIAAVLAGVESGGELNPVERLWLAIRKKLKVFDETIRTSLRALEEHVGEILRAFTPKEIASLTEYNYIRHALNAK